VKWKVIPAYAGTQYAAPGGMLRCAWGGPGEAVIHHLVLKADDYGSA
jgi:hypothetical protein